MTDGNLTHIVSGDSCHVTTIIGEAIEDTSHIGHSIQSSDKVPGLVRVPGNP